MSNPMTSPTTSADAVKVLNERRDELSYRLSCNPTAAAAGAMEGAEQERDALDLAIATLTQHAEAGAVAWMVEAGDESERYRMAHTHRHDADAR